MAQTVCVILSSSDRQMLEAIVADRNRPQKHVERARVVLAAASRDPVQVVATRLGVIPTALTYDRCPLPRGY